MGELVNGLRRTNRWLENSRVDIKYSIGNGVAKALICMAHGHEQQWGDCLREWGLMSVGRQREKNQDKWKSIINKI